LSKKKIQTRYGPIRGQKIGMELWRVWLMFERRLMGNGREKCEKKAYQRKKKRMKQMGSMSDQIATVAVWIRLCRGTCSGAKLSHGPPH
jgi:hypothetical protein